jgi:hypothetical protein
MYATRAQASTSAPKMASVATSARVPRIASSIIPHLPVRMNNKKKKVTNSSLTIQSFYCLFNTDLVLDPLLVVRDWERDYGWGVRVRRPFGARGMSSVRYGTRLGDLKNKQSTHTDNGLKYNIKPCIPVCLTNDAGP